MRYWNPFIADACAEVSRGGFGRVVLLPLYPHESGSTTGSSINEARRCLRKVEYAGEIHEVRSFWENPGYLEAFAAGVSSALGRAPEGTRVLFSAHGLPLSIAAKDPYPGQVAAAVREVCRRLGLALDPVSVPGRIPEALSSFNTRHSALSTTFRATLAWQSKVGPMKWLGPSVETILEEWSTEEVKEVVLVPVSFVNEHSETLYELDVLYCGMARDLGMTVRRVPTLGTAPAFIDGLAARVTAACE
jgi:protoporphyrin/coproporphyrin ferrochelatase